MLEVWRPTEWLKLTSEVKELVILETVEIKETDTCKT
jgi:hypothetical protein